MKNYVLVFVLIIANLTGFEYISKKNHKKLWV